MKIQPNEYQNAILEELAYRKGWSKTKTLCWLIETARELTEMQGWQYSPEHQLASGRVQTSLLDLL